MTKEQQIIVTRFETRMRQMILKYKDIEAENQALYEMVDDKEAIIKQLNEQICSLKTQYANLKMAKMIEIGGGEMKDAKSRLAKLVRDVDKCIALLNI